MKKLYKVLLYIMPLMLLFSYFPVIKLGENETMYFELSLPLIWLVIFDVVSLIMTCKKYRQELFSKVFGSILWWLFPLFATFSVIWSLNVTRGVLTAGVMWALFFAVISFWELRENLDAKFWKIFWRWFFGSALLACLWCVVQCILDVSGVSQEASLLCDGCVYQMFGFPHPNGWAIEPQFMGNLLIAPTMAITWMLLINNNSTSRTRVALARRPFGSSASQGAVCHGQSALILGRNLRKVLKVLLLFVFLSTLFLTFSRGAIYATIVGLIFLFSFAVVRAKKTDVKKVFFNTLKTLGVFVFSFVFALNLQGILTAVSPTSDTYGDGVAKVLNHLSLGIIEIRGESEEKAPEGSSEPVLSPVLEEPVENSSKPVENSVEEAAFDGYVAESTDTRVRLFKAALEIWKKDFKTAAIGVGLGGAGQALYDNDLSPAPREIVQNEYASILLEMGVVGISLFILIIVMAARAALKNRMTAGLVLSLMVAYGVTFVFFSGLTNALQIVLIPALFIMIGWEKNRAKA